MMMGKVGRVGSARVTLGRLPWDVGPLTRLQLAGKVAEPVMTVDPDTGKSSNPNPNRVMRTRRETWIGRYHRKGKLSDAQMNIACELFEASQGFPARDVLAALRIDQTAGDYDPQVAQVDRRRKFFQMAGDVPVFARPVITHVVLHDQSIRCMPGRVNGRFEEAQLDRLQRGLDALHDAWGRKLLTRPKLFGISESSEKSAGQRWCRAFPFRYLPILATTPFTASFVDGAEAFVLATSFFGFFSSRFRLFMPLAMTGLLFCPPMIGGSVTVYLCGEIDTQFGVIHEGWLPWAG